MNIFTAMEEYSNKLAVVSDKGEEISYSDLFEFSKIIGQKLINRSLVFCLCKNTIGSLLGYFSFIHNKVVPVLLDGNKDSYFIENLLKLYKPNYIWVDQQDYNPNLGEIIFKSYGYYLVLYDNSFKELHPKLALLLTTSGSTGSPKLVRLSYENILSNAESIAEYLKISYKERPITSLPMYYSFGLSVINSHFIKGATILLTDKPVIQKEFWHFAKSLKATSLSGVPYTYEMLNRLRILQADLPNLKTFTQAGGKLNDKLIQDYIIKTSVLNKEFIVMYGQTEATARMSYLPFNVSKEKYKSIGIPIPGGFFSLIDSNGNEILDSDVEGELVYFGKNVSLGYASCIADLSLGDVNNGKLLTGDIAKRDSDGFYYITGRLKRFVKVFGNRINLDSVENIIKETVVSCACVGVDDKITVFTTISDVEELIKNLLFKALGLNKRVFDVKVIPIIPKSNSGKIQYSELIKLL